MAYTLMDTSNQNLVENFCKAVTRSFSFEGRKFTLSEPDVHGYVQLIGEGVSEKVFNRIMDFREGYLDCFFNASR